MGAFTEKVLDCRNSFADFNITSLKVANENQQAEISIKMMRRFLGKLLLKSRKAFSIEEKLVL